MDETLISAKYIEPLLFVLLVWLLKEVFMYYQKAHEKQNTDIAENTKAILKLDLTMVELHSEIKHLGEQIRPLQNLSETVIKLNERIHNFEKRVKI